MNINLININKYSGDQIPQKISDLEILAVQRFGNCQMLNFVNFLFQFYVVLSNKPTFKESTWMWCLTFLYIASLASSLAFHGKLYNRQCFTFSPSHPLLLFCCELSEHSISLNLSTLVLHHTAGKWENLLWSIFADKNGEPQPDFPLCRFIWFMSQSGCFKSYKFYNCLQSSVLIQGHLWGILSNLWANVCCSFHFQHDP